MPYLPGESVNLGIGGESQANRGVAVAPTSWIPARTPTGIRTVLEKTLIRETRASGVMSSGSEITQKRAEGDLEFNLRAESIGWFLLSFFGSVSSVAKSGGNSSVYDHTFSVNTNPQHPTLTYALRQPNIQDYEYAMGIVGGIEIRTPVNDLVNATTNLMAKSEAEHAPYTVSFNETNDPVFRGRDVTIKIATSLAGLDAAQAVGVKEFTLPLNNNARPNQVLNGSTSPNDMLSLLGEFSGTLKLDYTAKTYHDYFVNGTAFALRVEMTRTDITFGASANPKLVFDFPKVTIEDYSPDRPLDDIAMEELQFTAHYDATSAKTIIPVLTNLKQSYNVA